MYGVGIIGAGVVAQSHLKAWRALGGRARCFAVAEIDAHKRAEVTRRHFLPVDVADHRDLLRRDDVDIVCICTPPCIHEEIVAEALQAGKYVLCEKPLTPTLAGIDRIIEVASGHRGKLSTVFQLRYAADMQKLMWLVKRGHLGPLVAGHAVRRCRLAAGAETSSGWWGRWDVAGGGIVMTQFVHHLDQLICIFGRPTRVEATMRTECQPIESEDSFSAEITFEGGAVVTCEGTLNAPRFEWEVRVDGELMTAQLPWLLTSSDERHLRQVQSELDDGLSDRSSLTGRLYGRLRNLGRRNGQVRRRPASSHEPYFAAVLDAIDADQPLPIPAEEARKSVELCTAIYTSAITGRPADLPLDCACPFYEGVRVDDYRNACAAVA